MPLGKVAADGVGQGEVHVVAAEEDVLTHGQTGQGEVAPLVGHGDQREVGRPAADVADQEQVAHLDLLPPTGRPARRARHRRRPAAPPGGHVLQAGGPGGLDGQVARGGVERRGDGQEDVLGFEAVGRLLAGDGLVPRVPEVGQVGGRGLDGRDLGHVVGGSPGEDRALAVDPGVRQPALGRPDQPSPGPWRRGRVRTSRRPGPPPWPRAGRGHRRRTPCAEGR